MRRRIEIAAMAAGFCAFITTVALMVTMVVWPLPERLQATDSVVVRYDDGQTAHVFLSSDDKWRVHVDRQDVDPNYTTALLRFEDKRFHYHMGVDPIAVLRAVWLNATLGRRTSGASTITMQLVRVLEPRPRTLTSKVIEAIRATQLELYMSKDEILAGYFRFAPFGRNIEGVEAASLAFFGHSSDDLTPEEIATLLAVPQNPNNRYPKPANVERLREARNRIADWLLEERSMPRGIDDEEVTDAQIHAMVVDATPPDSLEAFPRDIPHVAYWLRKKHPQRTEFDTTLDRGMQQIAERILESHRESAELRGIQNASVVLADHDNGEIRALIGNFSFDKKPGSQIAGFDVKRSPGSLLKPFISAASIDAGTALPETLLMDVPSTYGTYSPRNYDENFRGLVRMEDALAKSLNIPFVRLLKEIGTDAFIGMLRDMGGSSLKGDPGYYGLSAAVGSVELTPIEVAQFYATLSNDGTTRELRFDKMRPKIDRGLSVMSPGSSWLVRKALRTNDRPGFNRRRMNPNATPILWKTGTSYGFRDAWAAGSGTHYTAVVWMGNFDNAGNASLLGSERSGPVLFDLLETVENVHDADDPMPDELVELEVCAYSGHIKTDACPHSRTAHALSHRVPTTPCPYHKKIDIEVDTGRALAPSCRAGRDYKTKTFLTWPASVRRYLSDRHRFAPKIPMLAEDCRPTDAMNPPKIISPLPQTVHLMPGVAAERQEVPLEAETEVSGVQLSWFVDGEFIGTATAEDRLWWTPKRGEFEVLVMDDAGQASKRTVVVR